MGPRAIVERAAGMPRGAAGVALASLLGCAAPPPAPPVGAAGPDAERVLRDKAAHFRELIRERHLSREGTLLYEVRLSEIREQLETGTHPALADTPTYTGLLAATACTRAGVESGDARDESLRDARAALLGMRFLTDVTGRPGLLARGVQRGPVPVPRRPHHRWFAGAEGFEGYAWRGDASLDQYANGLLPAVAECAAHHPELARGLIADAASFLIETELQIVDPDGRRTRFGDLSPGSGLGFNSIARLTGYGVFALAAALDGDPRFAARRDALRDDHRVVATSTRTNLRVLGITNFSNDLMAWNLYRSLIPLARRTGDPALADLRRGLDRTWERVRRDRNPYFTLLLCELAPDACPPHGLARARDTLLRFPLEKRKLAPPPGLAELPRALLPGRKWRRRARDLVPIELRPASSLEWKSSPYRVAAGVDPDVEYTGLDYLAAYWVYRRVSAGGHGPGSARAPDLRRRGSSALRTSTAGP